MKLQTALSMTTELFLPIEFLITTGRMQVSFNLFSNAIISSNMRCLWYYVIVPFWSSNSCEHDAVGKQFGQEGTITNTTKWVKGRRGGKKVTSFAHWILHKYSNWFCTMWLTMSMEVRIRLRSRMLDHQNSPLLPNPSNPKRIFWYNPVAGLQV